MRKAALILLALGVLAAPAGAALQKRDAGDGTVSVEGGRGQVTIQARGAVIGRLESGYLQIIDLSPDDANEPIVVGKAREKLNGATRVWSGKRISFRIIGGSYRVVMRGTGIDVSAVGRGFVQLRGEAGVGSGLYSLTGDDCGLAPERCQLLPEKQTRFDFGDKSFNRAPSSLAP